jgi:hypothetical protein
MWCGSWRCVGTGLTSCGFRSCETFLKTGGARCLRATAKRTDPCRTLIVVVPARRMVNPAYSASRSSSDRDRGPRGTVSIASLSGPLGRPEWRLGRRRVSPSRSRRHQDGRSRQARDRGSATAEAFERSCLSSYGRVRVGGGGRDRLGSGRGQLEPRDADRATERLGGVVEEGKPGAALACSPYRTKVEVSSNWMLENL